MDLSPKDERYANQDYVGCREAIFSIGDVSEIFRDMPKREWPEFVGDKKRLVLELFFLDQRKQCEIVEMTGLSKGYVSQIISKAKRKIGLG